MRTLMLIAVGLAFIVNAGPAMAQKKNSGVYPWERKGEQLRRAVRRNPLGNPLGKLLGDPMAKIRARDEKALKMLGLPSNTKFPGFKSPSTEESATVGLDRYANLDEDRDGYISREEYMIGRFRGSRVGPLGDLKRRRYQSKLASRFRAADRNRDGQVSSQEIAALRNPRF